MQVWAETGHEPGTVDTVKESQTEFRHSSEWSSKQTEVPTEVQIRMCTQGQLLLWRPHWLCPGQRGLVRVPVQAWGGWQALAPKGLMKPSAAGEALCP